MKIHLNTFSTNLGHIFPCSYSAEDPKNDLNDFSHNSAFLYVLH